MKLWLMYRNEFGTSQAFVGRDCFCAILSKYKLTIRKRFRAPRTTDSSITCHTYLTRTLLLEHPDQLWVSDITYITIWLPDGSYVFCYLSLVTDAYTKRSGDGGDTLGSCYTVEALEMAVRRIAAKEIKGLIHHSDRGVQYASADYIAILRHNGILPSMTEDGNPKDNAIAERVNGIIKNELLQGMRFSSIQECQKSCITQRLI
ncbi:MAG: DDE-type integrase/transposase/recombinase [Bacteroides thetaiotaomicron]